MRNNYSIKWCNAVIWPPYTAWRCDSQQQMINENALAFARSTEDNARRKKEKKSKNQHKLSQRIWCLLPSLLCNLLCRMSLNGRGCVPGLCCVSVYVRVDAWRMALSSYCRRRCSKNCGKQSRAISSYCLPAYSAWAFLIRERFASHLFVAQINHG